MGATSQAALATTHVQPPTTDGDDVGKLNPALFALLHVRTLVLTCHGVNRHIGHAHIGKRIRLLIAGAQVRIIDEGGQLLRELTIEPDPLFRR